MTQSFVNTFAMELRELDNIGRYEIVREIGRGGFAVVYLGKDPYINRAVALKVSEVKQSKGSRPALSRLFQEAEAAGSLIHPNIVITYDAGVQDEHCFIAMEYIEGETLFQHCTPANLLPVADALDVIIKVCHGLDFAHQRGIIHRDIKPSNILLGTSGEIKITDFGLACFAELSDEEPRTVGTPSYMSPEQVDGKQATPRSDVFSAGVILYQLLCGKKPFDAQGSLEVRRKILKEPHVPLSTRDPKLQPELFAITDRALSKNPDERFATAFDLARDLTRVLKGKSQPVEGKLAEHVKQIRTLNFFEDFSDDETAHIITIGAWLSHKDGEMIVREEEKGDAFFVIASGEAKVTVGGKSAGTLKRGDSFGEISFLLGRKRSATIAAKGECHLLRLNPEKIDILPQETQIKLYRLFARTIAGYLLRTESKEK